MKRRGRPILGAISGLLFGFFLGADLWIFGVVPLDSMLLGVLPFLGLAGGIALGLFPVFGTKRPDLVTAEAAAEAVAAPPSGDSPGEEAADTAETESAGSDSTEPEGDEPAG